MIATGGSISRFAEKLKAMGASVIGALALGKRFLMVMIRKYKSFTMSKLASGHPVKEYIEEIRIKNQGWIHLNNR